MSEKREEEYVNFAVRPQSHTEAIRGRWSLYVDTSEPVFGLNHSGFDQATFQSLVNCANHPSSHHHQKKKKKRRKGKVYTFLT
jgi:hypothetical protein